jgi:hypothetical protein
MGSTPTVPTMRIMTGYFGIPGRFGGKVHIVVDGKPACGTPMDPRAEFQWNAHGIVRSYLECDCCKALLAKAPKWLLQAAA